MTRRIGVTLTCTRKARASKGEPCDPGHASEDLPRLAEIGHTAGREDVVDRSGRTWLWFYAGVGCATLVFQTWVRWDQCTGMMGCGLSFAKGLVWSTIWPASWVVFLAGLL